MDKQGKRYTLECMDKDIILGKNPFIDNGVILCYNPSRKLLNRKLVIGDNAIIRSNTVIYAGVTLGDNFESGHNVVIREENIAGNSFNVWNNAVIDYGCKIGNNVKIHSNVYVAQYTTMEDNVFLAPGVVIANDIHPNCDFSSKCMKGPTIKQGAQIGVNVTILPFITIGEYSLIGAGSVVTKDIPPRSVALGNPARVVKTVDDLTCSTGLTDKPYK